MRFVFTQNFMTLVNYFINYVPILKMITRVSKNSHLHFNNANKTKYLDFICICNSAFIEINLVCENSIFHFLTELNVVL